MKLYFSSEFKNEIQEVGNTVSLMYLSLENDTTKRVEFQALWDEVEKVLNMSVDLSTLGEFQDPSFITVWYGDSSGEIIGEAFQLSAEPGNPLNLCWKRRDNDNTRDLNHIRVKFPASTVANIETTILSGDIKFLERLSPGKEGINTFLAMEGEYEDSDYITKESYKTFVRNRKSLANTIPLYLDKNGEKVTNKTQYKHYKSINIYADGHIGQPLGKKTRYTVSSGDIIEISGQCVYDLYQVSNSEYVLLGKDIKADISGTVLANVDTKTGDINDTSTGNYTIEGHSITFNTGADSDTADFIALLNFTPEIEDTELGYVKGVPTKVKSNILEFVTYLKWNVEYPTSLVHTDGNLVLIFDYMAGSSLWSTAKEPQRESVIKVYSESKINPSTDINIKTEREEDQFIMSTFFDIILPEDGVYDTSSRRYVYDITIHPKQENIGDSKWFPLDDYGDSVMILNTITILGSTANATSKVKFYCVQRPQYPLKLVIGASSFTQKEIGKEGLEIPSGLGVRTVTNIYVANPAEGYDTWEAEYEDLDADVIISSTLNTVVDIRTTDVMSKSASITASTRVPSCHSRAIELGKIKFHRRNTSGAYDPSYWEDLIYCHEDNSFELTLKTPAIPEPTPLLVVDSDPNRQNYPDLEYAPTKYFYKDESSENRRLYIFDPSKKDIKSFVATIQGSQYVTVTYSNQELFEAYFDMSIVYSGQTMLVTIGSKGLRSGDIATSWYPKHSDLPISVTIRDAYLMKSEVFYCVIRPEFSPLVMMKRDGDEYSTIPELELTDEENLIEEGGVVKHRQICYLTSDTVTSEFPYWTVFSKDSELRIFTESPATLSTWNNSGNILSSDPSVWGNQVPYITIDTPTVPYGPDDVKFEPIVIQRTTDTSHIGSLEELYSDWRNQLCEDAKVSVPVTLKSNVKSDTLTLLTYKKNSTVIEEITDDNIDLDYIGLYRLFVKSSGSFRVRLGSTNSLDGLYFFDPSNNVAKPNVLSLDEGAFDEINGREVCFVFYGFEDNAFEVESQVLKTKIYVTNLVDGTTKILTLTRKYFSRTSSLGVLESLVLDTNIKPVGSIDKDLFLPVGGDVLTRSISYKSNVETYAEYIPYDAENYKAGVFISDPTGKHDIKFSSYQIQSQVKRGTKITSFCSRGYISTEMNLTCSGISGGPDIEGGYPISPDGVIEIKNPGELPRVTKEKILTLVYCLLPAPTITTNFDAGLRQIAFQYNSGKSSILYVNAENGVYDIEYHPAGSVEFTKVEDGMTLRDINGNEHFRIDREPTLDQEQGEAWKIITTQIYEDPEENNLLVGGIRVKTYVPYNNFIKDTLGSVRTDYTQEQVNSILKPEEKNITLLRLSKKNSDDSIEGGNPDTLIDRKGETRVFLLNKVDEETSVDCEAYKNDWSGYISEIALNEETLELSVTYKDRLTRHGLNTSNLGSIQYTKKTVGGNSIYVLNDSSTSALSRMLLISNPIISNFSIGVGDKEVNSPEIYQNPWSRGISINGYGYVGSKTGQSYSVDYTGGTITLYIFGFGLPTTGDFNDRDNSNIKISSDKLSVTSTLEFVTGSFVDKVTNPTTTSGAGTSGWMYSFTVPENTGTYTSTYYVNVEDTYGNSVAIPIYSSPRNSFNVRFFKTCSSGILSNETRNVIFSASGEQRGDLYLATDDLAGTYTPTIVNSYYSPSIQTSSGERIGGSTHLVNSVKSYELVSTSATVSGEGSDKYRVFKVTLRSYVSQYTSSTANILTNPLASSPFYNGMDVGINSNSYKTLTCYHGSCSIQLTQPAVTYLSVRKDESGTETFMDYIPEFRQGDNTEYDKYTSSGSFLLSNNKPKSTTTYSKTYLMDNSVNISYSEQGSLGESKYEAKFDDYGYYCGWKILIVRREWFEEGGSLVVKNLEVDSGLHPTITTNSAAAIDTSMNMEKEYYNFTPESELLFVAFYSVGPTALSTDPPVGSSDPTIGVLMVHKKAEFRQNGKNYTLTSPRQIKVSFTGWEDITFFVNLTLDFTNN